MYSVHPDKKFSYFGKRVYFEVYDYLVLFTRQEIKMTEHILQTHTADLLLEVPHTVLVYLQ